VENLVKDLKEAIEKNDYTRMKIVMDDLQKKSQEIGQRLYQQASGSSSAAGDGAKGSSDESNGTTNAENAEYQGK
jgi:molecular chaperone DnaK